MHHNVRYNCRVLFLNRYGCRRIGESCIFRLMFYPPPPQEDPADQTQDDDGQLWDLQGAALVLPVDPAQVSGCSDEREHQHECSETWWRSQK